MRNAPPRAPSRAAHSPRAMVIDETLPLRGTAAPRTRTPLSNCRTPARPIPRHTPAIFQPIDAVDPVTQAGTVLACLTR